MLPQGDLLGVPPDLIKRGIANLSEGHCPKCDGRLINRPLFCQSCDLYFVLIPVELLEKRGGKQIKDEYIELTGLSVTVYQSSIIGDVEKVIQEVRALYDL